MNKRLWWSGVVVVSLALVACGGDDGGGDEPIAGTSGVGVSGVGGVGGASGASGASGMGGSGGTMSAMPVPCGTNTCQPLGGGAASMIPGLGAALPAPCCADEAMGTCGLITGGACTPPPASDPRCPPLSFAGMMVPSCCTSSGVCGANASQFGIGCINPGMFTGMPGMSCDGAEDGGAGTDADGGV